MTDLLQAAMTAAAALEPREQDRLASELLTGLQLPVIEA